MNLRDLEYLVAVADLGHFGKAAEACNVSQPTLSMQVKKLEEYLGLSLFERGSRRVLVTPAGEAIIGHARKALMETAEIRRIARHGRDPLAGEFTLGVFPTLGPYFLPSAVPVITETMPKLRLLLVEEKTPTLIGKLQRGELDAALLALPHGADGLEDAPLFTDPFRVAVPKGHALAARTEIRHSDLKGEPLLLLEDGHCLREQALEACALMGAGERQDFRATSLETLRHMVAGGVGITFMPEIAMQSDPSIRYLPFAGTAPSRTIGLVWRKGTARRPVMQKLVEILGR